MVGGVVAGVVGSMAIGDWAGSWAGTERVSGWQHLKGGRPVDKLERICTHHDSALAAQSLRSVPAHELD